MSRLLTQPAHRNPEFTVAVCSVLPR